MKQFALVGVRSPMHTHARLRIPTLLSLGLLLALAGCSSDDHGPARRGGLGGPRRQPPTPLAGQEVFFDGKIGVEIKVGAMEGAGDMTGGEPGGGGQEGGGHRRGGGTGGGVKFGLAGMSGGTGGEGSRRHGGSPREGEGSERREGPRPAMMGSMEPPVMIHLQFTNHGAERVVLSIVDFVSPFGNFAVQPEKLTLDPGQSLETEPMSSQLAGSLTEAQVTLALHLPGKNEKKMFVIHTLPARPAEAGTAPAQ